MKLYDWQTQCLNAWEENRFRGIVNVITGAGKTVLALHAIDRMRDLYPDICIRIVVPTIPLAHQWKKSLLHHVNDDSFRPGFYFGGAHDDPDRQVMIYVINSARECLPRHIRRSLALSKHVLLICDECHHYQSPQNRKIFQFLTPEIERSGLYASLGLSATPFGTANDQILIRSLGKEIFRYSFNRAVKEGIISPFTVCEVAASFFPKEHEEYLELSTQVGNMLARLLQAYPSLKHLPEGEFLKRVSAIAKKSDMDPSEPAAAFLLASYQRKKLSNLAKARVLCGIALIDRFKSTDRILIFCERIQQAKEMASILRRRYGNTCGLYHSEMSREARTRVLDEFRRRQTRILVSCRCLDEGIDVPDANIGIVLSSSAVPRQRIQRLGRIIRRSSDKDSACLYYIYIRESSDDSAYLPDLPQCDSFSLCYYPLENDFSNDLYEYVALELLSRAQESAYSDAQTKELRLCLNEGLVRADYLLPEQVLSAQAKAAQTQHLRNYWKIMQKISEAFHPHPERNT